MKTHKLNRSKRTIVASLILAGAILLGALLQTNLAEGAPFWVFVTTAVYMLGPLLSAVVMLPVSQNRKWLYASATLMSWAIVFPWAFIDTSAWVQTYMAQLGHYGNILFAMVIITDAANESKPQKHLWVVTTIFMMVLLIMPIIFSS